MAIKKTNIAPNLATPEGFEKAYRSYWKKMFGICYYYIKDEELAKEMVQNSLFFASEMAIDNIHAMKPKQIQMAGMDFTLLPDSRIEIATSVCNTRGEMSFCGNIALVNNQGHDVVLTVTPGCNTSQNRAKQVIVKAEKKYVVFQHNYKFSETYVVDVNKIRQLPPVLKHKVSQLTQL